MNNEVRSVQFGEIEGGVTPSGPPSSIGILNDVALVVKGGTNPLIASHTTDVYGVVLILFTEKNISGRVIINKSYDFLI